MNELSSILVVPFIIETQHFLWSAQVILYDKGLTCTQRDSENRTENFKCADLSQKGLDFGIIGVNEFQKKYFEIGNFNPVQIDIKSLAVSDKNAKVWVEKVVDVVKNVASKPSSILQKTDGFE